MADKIGDYYTAPTRERINKGLKAQEHAQSRLEKRIVDKRLAEGAKTSQEAVDAQEWGFSKKILDQGLQLIA